MTRLETIVTNAAARFVKAVRHLTVPLFLGFMALGAPALAAEREMVILDDDIGGISGAPPVLMQSPDIDVIGMTIVSGSTWRDGNVQTALRMMEVVGKPQIPVVPGSIFPLLNTEEMTRRWEGLYGRLYYKGAWTDQKWPEGTIQTQPLYHAYDYLPPMRYGAPKIKASDEIAAVFLVRKVKENPGKISIIATGPLTNIALAQSLDPSFAANVKQLIYMGGSLNPMQRIPTKNAEQFAAEYMNTPRREFNIRWDPEAARIVARAPWKKIVMVPVDPSTGTETSRAFLDRMKGTNTELAQIIASNEAGFPMWDEIAVAYLLDPTIATKTRDLYIDFETNMSAGYGDTLSWPEGYQPGLGERKETVVLDVDHVKLENLLVKLWTLPPARKPH
jgi:inosine-uridine nucleoside N-ribohydrolase